jgi:hypothetical protein
LFAICPFYFRPGVFSDASRFAFLPTLEQVTYTEGKVGVAMELYQLTRIARLIAISIDQSISMPLLENDDH